MCTSEVNHLVLTVGCGEALDLELVTTDTCDFTAVLDGLCLSKPNAPCSGSGPIPLSTTIGTARALSLSTSSL